MRLWPSACLSHHEAPLLRFGRDVWRVRDAYEGTAIIGAPGSGKTSASGYAIALALARAGWGGIVLCAKPDEADRWEALCRLAGRQRSLMRFDGSGRYRFNFLRYAMAAASDTDPVTNTVAVLTHVLRTASGEVGSPVGGGDNPFWGKSSREFLAHGSAVLWCAYGDITLPDLLKLIQSRPPKPDDLSGMAYLNGFMNATLMKCKAGPVHPMKQHDFEQARDYLTKRLPNPDPRTTGNLVATLSADLSPLLSGPMHELFGTDLTIVPEMTHEGAIIVLDFPLKVWNEAGHLAQHIFKYLWQRATERRGSRGRPVFLWADEGHLFASPYDAEFQSTARGARAATVWLTQNILGVAEQMGGRNPLNTAKALLGNFQTKIFHANSCVDTNQWAADTIAKREEWRESYSENEGQGEGDNRNHSWGATGGGGGRGRSENWNLGSSRSSQQVIEYPVLPAHFTTLRNGGRANRGIVDAVLFKGGQTWRSSKAAWMPAQFRQGSI